MRYARGRAGLLIVGIEPGGLAEHVSLAVGDVLVAANGRAAESVDDLAEAIDGSTGSVLKLRFVRGANPSEREVFIAVPQARREAA